MKRVSWCHPVAVGLLWGLLGLIPLAGCGDGGPSEEALLAVRYVEAGDKYLAKNDRRRAVAAYTKAIELDPTSKKAYLCRGMALSEMKEHDRALADYTKAIEIDPRDSFPYERRADLYRNAYHDTAKAKADDEKAALIREKRWSDLQKLSK